MDTATESNCRRENLRSQGPSSIRSVNRSPSGSRLVGTGRRNPSRRSTIPCEVGRKVLAGAVDDRFAEKGTPDAWNFAHTFYNNGSNLKVARNLYTYEDQLSVTIGRHQFTEGLWFQFFDHMHFSAQETLEFDIVIGLDIDANRIEIR